MSTGNKPKINMLNFYPGSWMGKLAFKVPILLWRMGLGPVLGRLMLLITTTGRKSKLPRRTMVEYYSLNNKRYIVSGFGAKSAWCKNMLADPRVTIQTAHGTERVVARRVSDDAELTRVYHLFKEKDPVLLNWYLKSLDIQPEVEDVVRKKERLYFFSFDPTQEPTPAPLRADLGWVWPVIFVVLLLGRFLVTRARLKSAK